MIIKSGYALPLQKSGLRQETDEIDIIGCDSDACVLATCFALFDGGYQFKILTPYIYSTGGDVMHNEAYDIMVRNFGKAVKKH